MKITVTDQAGEVHELEGLEGWRVMEVIRDWGLNIKAECGGACACATCHVYVDPEWLDAVGAANDDEEDMLDTVGDVKSNSRLSCQILCSDDLDGLKLTLAPSAAKD
ncbi:MULTISPECIES: 2Fe-2S iron-sulfur cluster-binding protein [unclassified Devosia]|uniref:2Fe-2S iron-sulfur cluster-binding protein n=1 Tax=unclassified Devosia TaxID=196773 RepID=UPI00145DADE3|nr:MULTISPECIES: 2Fe-2S iron-sulfur cluster-binding protein [unclassified Devosia]MBJ7577095.1 2Fe-2S iron-sulfur cluster binding domain-containing protein [Devosia sp. MC532]